MEDEKKARANESVWFAQQQRLARANQQDEERRMNVMNYSVYQSMSGGNGMGIGGGVGYGYGGGLGGGGS